MKRVILLLASAFVVLSANAIPLFPYIADIAGDYEESYTEDGWPVYFSVNPTSYKTLDEAKAFLNDNLPFSTETITVQEATFGEDEGKVILYFSPMSDGKKSCISLMEAPGKGFVIMYQ